MEDNDAKETALRGDVDWEADNGWLKAIKAGVRYSDRDQMVRYSAYNWSAVVATWVCNGPSFSLANTTPQSYAPSGCSAGKRQHPVQWLWFGNLDDRRLQRLLRRQRPGDRPDVLLEQRDAEDRST